MTRSQALFDRAVTCIPGGVNSPVRAFGAVGGTPRFAQRARGAYIYDADGRRYIDYVGSYGPMLLGHADPGVIEAVRARLDDGLSFGAPTEIEVEMAQTLCRLVPSMDQVRMVNSGTEATMSAIRLARGFTGRDKIIKFEGCYHGHGDALLVKAGSGALTLGQPNSPGVPADCVRHTLSAAYNDLDSVASALQQARGEVAAIIVEPVAGNMNCVLPAPGFLPGLRKLCDEAGAVLIFDEVMTGFRVALGGAQARYGVTPDITTLGKVIGGGMPVGALGGRADIMRQLTPQGPVYQAGTLSGNPIAMAAGLATLEALQAPGFYQALESKTEALTRGLCSRATQAGAGLVANYAGGMFGLFLTDQPSVTNYGDVMHLDRQRFARFFHGMLDQGIWLAPAAFEAAFMSAAHSEQDIEQTLAAASQVLTALGSVNA